MVGAFIAVSSLDEGICANYLRLSDTHRRGVLLSLARERAAGGTRAFRHRCSHSSSSVATYCVL
jgi:hypothetical protein